MPISRYWKPERFAREASNWLTREGNRELLLEQNLAEIQAFLDGTEPNFGESLKKLLQGSFGARKKPDFRSAVFALEFLAVWYETSAAARLFWNDPAGYEDLSTAFDCRAWEICLFHSEYIRRPSEKRNQSRNLNRTTFQLAVGIALERFDEATRMGKYLVSGIRAGMFYDTETVTLANFLIRLLCDWRGFSIPDELGSALPECFVTILQQWKLRNPSGLDEALLRACDYHSENCRWDSDEKTFELSGTFSRLFPAEILAVIRLRRSLGLTCAIPDHPVMNIPSAKLPEIAPSVRFQLLERLIEKAARELDVTSWDIEVPMAPVPSVELSAKNAEPSRAREYVEELKKVWNGRFEPIPDVYFEILEVLGFQEMGIDLVLDNEDYLESPPEETFGPNPGLGGRLVEVGLQATPAAIYTDWRFDPGDKVEAVADRLDTLPDLQSLGIELEIDRESDWDSFRLTVRSSSTGTARYSWKCPGELTPDEFFAALGERLPAEVEILAFRVNSTQDTSFHLVLSRSGANDLREKLGDDFERIFTKPPITVRFEPLE